MEFVHRETYYLHPGYIYISRQQETIQTVLGSCVAVCLWDQSQKCGGMNHFLYPVTREATNATPRFGNVAILALIKMMNEEGCRSEDLKAHILGGGHPEGVTGESLGDQNVKIAREILKNKGISIIAEDVGGSVGRKIAFDVITGHVAVLKVHKVRKEDWHTEEYMKTPYEGR
jgi:chemotaxis protein CheD